MVRAADESYKTYEAALANAELVEMKTEDGEGGEEQNDSFVSEAQTAIEPTAVILNEDSELK